MPTEFFDPQFAHGERVADQGVRSGFSFFAD